MPSPATPPGAARRQPRATPKGRQVQPAHRDAVAAAIEGLRPRRDLLIEHLHRLQDRVGALRHGHLAALAEHLRLSQAEVFEVASFYHHFDIVDDDTPLPALTVRVCTSLSCCMAGARDLLATLKHDLETTPRSPHPAPRDAGAALHAGLPFPSPEALHAGAAHPASAGTEASPPDHHAGHAADARGMPPASDPATPSAAAALVPPSDEDTGIRVIEAPCIGRCNQSPAVCVGQHAFGHATATTVHAAIARNAVMPAALAHIAYAHYREEGGYALLADCLAGRRSVESVIDALEASGLRGLGGAGFPTHRKWRAVREQPGPRVVAVNLDEGEVGTFKDHHCLSADPHRFLEGALIAAWAVGADTLYLYLRDEYHDVREMLELELHHLHALRAEGLALPTIELRRGAGAYICGEESAMIESIEGKRGLPRLRPPYVAQRGVFGRPTLVQNIETLSWVREIVERGGQWFAAQGRRGRSGLRRFSISGRVNRPGVALAPAGITLRELIDEHAGGLPDGHRLYAYLPGGASGGILPASLADIPLDFDTLAEHGCFVGSMAVVVLTESATHRDLARDAALNLMQFFAHESCGQCTPCREGTVQAERLMHAARWDAPLLRDLSTVMRDASICGLGQAAPNPMDCVMRYFPQEVGL